MLNRKDRTRENTLTITRFYDVFIAFFLDPKYIMQRKTTVQPSFIPHYKIHSNQNHWWRVEAKEKEGGHTIREWLIHKEGMG